MNASVIKCSVIQQPLNIHLREHNIRNVEEAFKKCAAIGSNLVCLPEAFATSLELPKLKKKGEPIPGETSDFLCEQAKLHNTFIVAGIVEKDGETIYSSSVLIDNSGKILDVYRRVHVHSIEKHFISTGSKVNVVKTPIGNIGMIIGYDINFPEVCRILFQKRVEIIVCPSQFPYEFKESVRAMAISRATENCCYVVIASSAGANSLINQVFMGNSMIVRSPVGLKTYSYKPQNQDEIIAEAGLESFIITADLDMAKIRREQNEDSYYNAALRISMAVSER